ncbi:outer membrane protein assembly factor BamD [Pedobacter yulinensis]|uniref:Outer membrane protein assembly factor BamD n=1 Tax=Pedobacter yulinensis TaxID=2126353 RepID=A0A2T3HHV4_9SPHI|nr:outer membrane protein assembly factor BamD [Pedobacter yulinensis]PST82010.1 outer membrane protein assembly factor BamD [Pedobacter yulinensis]
MFKIKHVFIVFMMASMVFAGCKSRFEKIRLSNNLTKKYQEAMRLYGKRDYSKALILFEELSQKYRGISGAETLNYHYAYTLYHLKDYTTARYQFKFFADTYPSSQYAEECRYMSAFCYYQDSPNATLDQENTYKAIDALQLFINLYPKSERVAQASKLISDLRGKLEDKAYANAKMYLDMGDYDIRNYKSAVVAFKNAQRDYPDIKYAEEMDFLIIKAQYLYAKNSLENRQEERYTEAIGFYNDFVEAHKDSKYLKDAEQLKKASEEGIESAKKYLAAIAEDQAKYKAFLEKTKKPDTVFNNTILKKSN